jgi:hypothetical protein
VGKCEEREGSEVREDVSTEHFRSCDVGESMDRNVKRSEDTHVNSLRKLLVFYFQVEECVEPE